MAQLQKALEELQAKQRVRHARTARFFLCTTCYSKTTVRLLV